MGRDARSEHGARLNDNRRTHIVAAVQISQKVIEEVPRPGPIVEVMVRVDDRQRRCQSLLFARGEPISPHGKMGGRTAHALSFSGQP